MATNLCSGCGASVEPSARFCASCGHSLRPDDGGESETVAQATRPTPGPSARESRAARFAPGHIVAERYRIVALAGRGGMGEVYRAEDMKLSQEVALKFLPEEVETDPRRLARFHAEVRTARQISHPNVCRVYDIGEVDGHHFLSMEYIHGEDLASLLRRIGRLPQEKALEIARDLCGGLGAAHDRNVLHRDLKPGNVMLDEHGVARIADFGLASLDEVRGASAREGTVAYQSPEQLEGIEATRRSDIYALGLLLYELFTGRRPFEAESKEALLRLQRSSLPSASSSGVGGMDPLVERAIHACLDSDPRKRPASARQVMAMLPGGDPLEAALAAGETPSPEAVAGAAKEGLLSVGAAAGLAGAALALYLAFALISERVMLHRNIPLPYSPEQLSLRAQQVLDRIGLRTARSSVAKGMTFDETIVRPLMAGGTTAEARKLRADAVSGAVAPILFWYRSSSVPLVPLRNSVVLPDDPPVLSAGEVKVELDPGGQLQYLGIVPPPTVPSRPAAAMDWGLLFSEAGLTGASFDRVPPEWRPPFYADQALAWRQRGVVDPMKVEAASFAGKPVWFEVLPAGRQPRHVRGSMETTTEKFLWFFIVAFYVVVVVVSAALAGRNLRLGRGDLRGARRIATFMFIVFLAGWIFGGTHVASLDETENALTYLGYALLVAAMIWLEYIALEPVVRSRWPQMMISWSRLLAGEWRDPLVGRDVLIGTMLGVITPLLNAAALLPRPNALAPVDFEGVSGVSSIAGHLATAAMSSIAIGLSVPIFIVLLYVVVRRYNLAAAGFWLAFTFVLCLREPPTPATIVTSALSAAVWTVMVTRFGVLTLMTSHVVLMVSFLPLSLDPTVWYFSTAMAPIGVLVALACYGFFVSVGERAFALPVRVLGE